MERLKENNFTKQETKAKSRYKLWVKYTNLSTPKIYYSYETHKSPSYGYNRLIALINKNRQNIKVAIMYDNHTGAELERYNFS